jgi:hypothetical protein
MKELIVGLLVLLLAGALWLLGVLLFPLLIVFGFFLRMILMLVLAFFAIWLIGKATLLLIESLRRK